MNILKPILVVTILIFFISCKEKHNEKTADVSGSVTNGNVAIQVTMEGKTHSISQKDIIAKEVNFAKDTLELMFRAEGNPFELNLNFINSDIITKGSGTYSLTGTDNHKSGINLNFLNTERKGRTIDRRVVFNKGTITIEKLSKNELQMTFDGEASPMMDFKNENSFPVSGKVDINY